MTQLKIFQVISADLWAGAENQCYQLCAQLHQRNIKVYPVLFNEGELKSKLEALGITVQVWDESKEPYSTMLKRAVDYIKKHQPSVIHTHGPKEAFIFGTAKILMRSPVKIIKTIHGSQEHQIPFLAIRKQLIKKIKQWVDNHAANHFVAVSPELELALLKKHKPEKVSKIINAIDCRNLIKTDNSSARKNTPNNTLRLGMFARLVNVKRHDLAIDALALLNNSAIDNSEEIELHIYGDGPRLPALIELCKSLQISEQIIFHGFITNSTEAMQTIDAMIMPSDHEGTPMALLESMALGIPVIGHNVGGIKDVLSITNFGVQVEQHDAQGYANGILELINRLPAFRSNRESALQKFQRHYDINTMCTLHIDLYKKLSNN